MIITLFGGPRAVVGTVWRPFRRLLNRPQLERPDQGIARQGAGWVLVSDMAGSEEFGRGRLVTWRESGAGEAAALRARIESFTPAGAPVIPGAEVRLRWERADAMHAATVQSIDATGATIDLNWLGDDLPDALREQQVGQA